MNERGFASLTAILILMMLAYLIRGTIYTAQNSADMIRNFELEHRLQLAAESALENELHLYDQQSVATDPNYTNNSSETPDGVDGVVVKVATKTMTFDGSSVKTIVIVAIAKKNNYFANGIHAYRSVGGFLTKVAGSDKYKFKGFFHRTI